MSLEQIRRRDFDRVLMNLYGFMGMRWLWVRVDELFVEGGADFVVVAKLVD